MISPTIALGPMVQDNNTDTRLARSGVPVAKMELREWPEGVTALASKTGLAGVLRLPSLNAMS